MISRFFVALTTESNKDRFLIVAYDLAHGQTMAVLLPEEEADFVEWGQTLWLEITDDVEKIGEYHFPYAAINSIEEPGVNRQQAAHAQEQANKFIEESGWTEEAGENALGDVMQEWEERFSRFPEGPDENAPILH